MINDIKSPRVQEKPSKTEIFVSNIPQDIQIYEIRTLFETIGKVVKVSLVQDQKNVIYSVLAFEYAVFAIKAIQKYNQTIQFGGVIKVSLKNYRNDQSDVKLNKQLNERSTICISNLPLDIKQYQVRELCLKIGKIVNIYVRHPKRKDNTVYSLIQFQSSNQAVRAIQNYNNTFHFGKNIEVNFDFSNIMGIENERIFISGLPQNVLSSQLQQLFQKVGIIMKIYISQPEEIDRPLYSFITFQNKDVAKNAIQQYNHTIQFGKYISISFAHLRKDNAQMQTKRQKTDPNCYYLQDKCDKPLHLNKQGKIKEKRQRKQANQSIKKLKPFFDEDIDLNYREWNKAPETIEKQDEQLNTTAPTETQVSLSREENFSYEIRAFNKLKDEEQL